MKKNSKLEILFEDKHLIIINKKSGLPTIKSEKDSDNLYSQVFEYLHKKNQRVFIVHRLDKDTSGIVIFAKSEKAQQILQENWEYTTRNYIALVHGITKENGVIKSYLKETKTLYSYSVNDSDGKYAETSYEKINSNSQYSLLKINIKTGRKNQIRVHMHDNNTPILGDRKYGVKDGFRKMMLLANQIIFIHPITKEKLDINLGIPSEYKRVIDNG